jgi:hypothetical protein
MTLHRSGVDRRTVVCLGISQLVCWGISYYLIGVFGELIAAGAARVSMAASR